VLLVRAAVLVADLLLRPAVEVVVPAHMIPAMDSGLMPGPGHGPDHLRAALADHRGREERPVEHRREAIEGRRAAAQHLPEKAGPGEDSPAVANSRW
jgi:hypothetical protein